MFQKKLRRRIELHISLRDVWEDEDGMYEYDPETQLTSQAQINFGMDDETIKQAIEYNFKDFMHYLKEGMFH